MPLESQTIDEALRLEELTLPESPKVVRLVWEPYEDWQGEAALRVWVLLSDATEDDEITGGAVSAIKSEIWRTIHDAGVDLFVYVRFARETEYETIVKRA